MNTFAKICMMAGLSVAMCGQVWADWDRRHGHGSRVYWGVHVGSPWVYPPAPYWPRVYVPPTVIVASPPPPTVYVEQSPVLVPAPAAAVPTLEPGYWYYCNELGAYYPQVKQCPGDWRKVAPQSGR